MIILLLSAAFTGLVVHYSVQHGRLLLFLTYDDVGYLGDAASRLETFYKNGIGQVVALYCQSPPHAPWSTALGFTAFAIGGFHDWAPYAANVVLVITYFVFADYLLKGVALWQKLLCFALLASTPLLAWAVSEFRPDHAAALFLTIGLVLILRRPLVSASRGYQILAGAFCGFSIWCKPQTFIAVICLTFAALALALVCDWIGEGLQLSPGSVLGALLACLIPFVLIPLPHFLVAGKEVWRYIYDTVFGRERHVWQTQGTLGFHLTYYLWGAGGQAMLGGSYRTSAAPPQGLPYHLVLIVIALAVAVARLVRRARRRELVRGAAIGTELFFTYMIPSMMKNKTPFFGLEFHTLLLFVTIIALRDLLLGERLAKPWRRAFPLPVASIGLVCLTIAGVAHAGLPTMYGDRDEQNVANRREIPYHLYADLKANTDYANPNIFVPSAGDVEERWLKYMAIKDGVSMHPYGLKIITDDPAYSLKEFNKANFVVISDAGSGLIPDFLPSFKTQDQLVKSLKSRQDYVQIGRYVYRPTGMGYYLFEHVGAFFGWRPGAGFGPLEGPIPQQNLPHIRWGYGPFSTCLINVHAAGEYTLSFRARNGFLAQVITVSSDGQPIARIPLKASLDFQPAKVAFSAPAGDHVIRFDYAQWAQPHTRPLAVLFSQLQIRKAR